MKKAVGILLVVLSIFAMSCSNNVKEDNGKVKIIATTFPVYDWTRKILGDRINDVDLRLLVDSGVDLHSFQPSIQDITEISTADMFMYIGGPSDLWVHNALSQKKNDEMIIVNMIDILGDDVMMEELVEGMTETEHAHAHGDEHNHDDHGHEDEHDHDDHGHDDHDDHGHDDHDEHNHDDHGHEDEHNHGEHEEEHVHDENCDHDHEEHTHDDHSDEHHEEADEHIWLSLQNAEIFVAEIAHKLGHLDPEYANLYGENAKAYIEKLHALDHEYEDAVSSAAQTTLVIADRFPFAYLVDDYDLSYHAAFVGCSAETEASFETIVFLSNKIDELDLHNIIMIEGTTHQIPQTVAGNTVHKDQNIVVLDSMQATARADIDAGATYLGIMEENLEVLKKVLAN